MKIKLALLGILAVIAVPAYANITLILSGEEDTAQGGKICIYENSQRTETIKVDAGRSCPHTYTIED